VNDPTIPGGREPRIFRGVALIIVAGAALGIPYNTLLHASGPRRGLDWIKHESKMGRLEDVVEPASAVQEPVTPAEPAPATDVSSPTATDLTGEPAPVPASTSSATPKKSTTSSHTSTTTTKSSSKSTKPATKTATTTTPATTTTTPSGTAAAAPKVDLPAIPDTKEPLEAQYATIKKFWDAHAALFVDARTPEEYKEGHIPGAVNLDFEEVFKDPDLAKKLDSKGKPIITYCGGGDCELSKSLASALIDAGHKKVLVFMGGAPGWKEQGNELVTGTAPGGSGDAP